MSKKITLSGLAMVAFICVSVPLAQAKMNNVPIQNLTLVQETSTKTAIKAKKDHDDHHHHHHHHHHHDHHHGWHHHGVSGGVSGNQLPAPQVDLRG